MKDRVVLFLVVGFVSGMTTGASATMYLAKGYLNNLAKGLSDVVASGVEHKVADLMESDSYDIPRTIQRRTTEQTSHFAEQYLKTVQRLPDRAEHLRFALSKVDPAIAENGLFCEFGVAGGYTINVIADAVPNRTIHGFDSFEGIPDAWDKFARGSFKQQQLPDVRKNVTLHKGWFDKSIGPFLQEAHGQIAFLHLDADLYSSTKTVFDLMEDRIGPGTIIAFDEYFNYPGWQNDGEYKAFREFATARKLAFEYTGYANTQLSLKILPPGSPSAGFPPQ